MATDEKPGDHGKEPSHVERTLEFALSASKRSRYCLVALVVLTLVLATELFNSWKHSWANERVQTYRHALALYVCAAPPPEVARPMPTELANAKAESVSGGIPGVFVPPFPESWDGGCDGECGRVAAKWAAAAAKACPPAADYVGDTAQFVLMHGLGARDIATGYEALQAGYVDRLSGLSVPLVNLHIDVNGLGVLGGAGFLALLFMLSLAVDREVRVFAKIHDPKEKGEATEPALFERQTALAVTWTPVLVFLLIVLNDVLTIARGWVVSQWATGVTCALEVVMLVAILYMASRCSTGFGKLGRAYEPAVPNGAASRVENPITAEVDDSPVRE